MTTRRSPLSQLKRQADAIAMMLKQAERRELPTTDVQLQFAQARAQEGIRFAIVMDDQVLKVEMQWSVIESTSEVAIAEYILRYMRGRQETMQ